MAVSSIIAVYNGTDSRLPSRSDEDHARLRAEGARWYRDNRRMIRRESDELNLPRSVVAAVYAAFSINNNWQGNVKRASACLRHLLQHATPDMGLHISQSLALAAYDAMDGDVIESLIGKNARKVRTFYGAFMGRSSVKPVIDRHASDIAGYGKKVPDGKNYERIAAEYVEAARIIGIRPEELQAATWTIWRGTGN